MIIWGNVTVNDDKTTVNIIDGSLRLNALKLPYLKSVSEIYIDGCSVPFEFNNGIVSFDEIIITDSVVFIS